jgi:hypothetical protein
LLTKFCGALASCRGGVGGLSVDGERRREDDAGNERKEGVAHCVNSFLLRYADLLICTPSLPSLSRGKKNGAGIPCKQFFNLSLSSLHILERELVLKSYSQGTPSDPSAKADGRKYQIPLLRQGFGGQAISNFQKEIGISAFLFRI